MTEPLRPKVVDRLDKLEERLDAALAAIATAQQGWLAALAQAERAEAFIREIASRPADSDDRRRARSILEWVLE